MHIQVLILKIEPLDLIKFALYVRSYFFYHKGPVKFHRIFFPKVHIYELSILIMTSLVSEINASGSNSIIKGTLAKIFDQ